MMRRSLLVTAALLFGVDACLAQVSTMGTTAMGLPSTPGAIVSSPLNGPSPFSAATQPGAPDTTLAPLPLALDPTTPGTVVTCAPLSGQSATTSAAAGMGSVSGSTTGVVPAMSPLGTASTTSCSATPGGSPSNGASLPLTTPAIAANASPGAIQPGITELGGTSIDPTTTVVPTPNASACAESVTMNLATPAMMPSANATGAPATPGVSAPSGC
jgi:hypothetical protein